MSRAKHSEELMLGVEPRVDLLPPEVKAGKKARETRRRLGAVLVGVLVLVGAGTAAASWQAEQSRMQLADAQSRSTELLAEQAKYAEVNQIQAALDITVAAREFGSATEIDWKAYLSEVKAVLPADVSIDSVGVDSASPLVAYGQPTAPLQAARVATLSLGLTSPNLPTVPEWLDALRGLPGYADANPGSISLSTDGAYTVELVMHINSDAYSNRFASTEEK
ncbi:hypothetical protein E3T40_15060 [Cryobacterium sp. TMT1-19]|uniref:hypothetical protein n=1 Tax=Cryobacterium sp. TMT1-19 TaxID=1259231 RepID=UPI00106CDEE8|nr:hypothetical protein [Cryobacterium sp. TMT1-19]TFD30320.1 hypothetical protein E3T40_15060 [Cryobacterium sp. TMT1-19]